MRLTRNPGRIAGLWYLLLVLLGPLRLIYILQKLFVRGDAAATAANIAAHPWLFRSGLVSDLAGAVVLILLTMAFFRLFAGVSKPLAALVVIFGGILPALLYFVGVTLDSGALFVIQRAPFLSVFSQPQQDAIAFLLLRLHALLDTAAETLWGVWLLPLALLVFRSRFLPRFLAVWLALNGLAYILISLTGELLPHYQDKAFLFAQPALLAEVVFTAWLLIKGANPPHAPGVL